MSDQETMEFTAKVKGEDKSFEVLLPTLEQQRAAQRVYNEEFNNAISSKAPLRAKLTDLMKEQNMWDDAKEAEVTMLQTKIHEGEKRLHGGGFKLSDAKKLAFDIRGLRAELIEIIAVRTEMDSKTAEGQADNMKFNFLASCCLVYNDSKKPYFDGLDAYLNSQNDDVAISGAPKLANALYGLDEDYRKKQPENKFLIDFGFADDNLRLINDKGHFVDMDGRLINEEGYWVEYEGDEQFIVNKEGDRIDRDGMLLGDSKPFLADDGSEVVIKRIESEEVVRAEEASESK